MDLFISFFKVKTSSKVHNNISDEVFEQYKNVQISITIRNGIRREPKKIPELFKIKQGHIS